MTAKSIIDIEINDSRFQEFLKLYEKYSASLGKTADKWTEAGKTVDNVSSSIADMTAAMLAQVDLLNKENYERKKGEREQAQSEKRTREGEKAAVRASQDRQKAMKKMADDAKSVAGSVAKTAGSLLKWGSMGLIGGLVGAGSGLFGLGALAGSVGDARRSAMGLGTTTGRAQAFNINYGRIVGPDSLNRIADAQGSLADRWSFMPFGITNPQDQDPAELAARMAPKAKAMFERGGKTQEYAQAVGLTKFYSMEELRRLSNTSMSELQSVAKAYREDAKTLALDDEASKKWQDFSVQLRRAGSNIKAAFVDGLVPLVPKFTELSEKFADFIREGLQSDKFKEWIDNAGVGLQKFTEWVGSDEFHAKLKEFATNVGLVAEGLVRAMRLLGLIPQAADPVHEDLVLRRNAGTANVPATAAQMSSRNDAMSFWMGRGYGRGAAAGLVANEEAESGFNSHVTGDSGKAYGAYQWHPDRQAAFKRWSGMDIRDQRVTANMQREFLEYEMSGATGDRGAAAAGRALKNPKISAYEAARVVSQKAIRPRDFLGAESDKRGGMAVKIDQTSGANDNMKTAAAKMAPAKSAAQTGGGQGAAYRDANGNAWRAPVSSPTQIDVKITNQTGAQVATSTRAVAK